MSGLGFIDPDVFEPQIRVGLDGVLARNDAGWTPDYVLESLRAGKAFCFGAIDEEDDSLEFVILRTKETHHGRVLFIWIAWSEDGMAIGRHWTDVKEIGREAGCRHVEFWSARSAFERVGKQLGVEPWMTIYRGDL